MQGYNRFVAQAALSRGMSFEDMGRRAQGRVWTGAEAKVLVGSASRCVILTIDSAGSAGQVDQHLFGRLWEGPEKATVVASALEPRDLIHRKELSSVAIVHTSNQSVSAFLYLSLSGPGHDERCTCVIDTHFYDVSGTVASSFICVTHNTTTRVVCLDCLSLRMRDLEAATRSCSKRQNLSSVMVCEIFQSRAWPFLASVRPESDFFVFYCFVKVDFCTVRPPVHHLGQGQNTSPSYHAAIRTRCWLRANVTFSFSFLVRCPDKECAPFVFLHAV